jgi:HlyD family secretion protein
MMAANLRNEPVPAPVIAPAAVDVIGPTPNLPAIIPTPAAAPAAWGWKRPLLLVLVLAVAAAGGTYWWLHRLPLLPSGIAFGNGRLEADEIDIDTKFAGKIASLAVDEGDVVAAGETVGMMDSQDLEASLAQARALVLQAQQTVQQAMATVAMQRTQVVFARQELDRATTLAKTGFETREMVDTRRQALNGATDTVNADIAAAGAAAQALDAARQAVVLDQVNIGYNTLVAPRAGTIEYRIANIGEVLPAGGKVFTMLDRNDVYMDVYLSTADAGRTRIGSDARILLDAYPGHPIAAAVTFVAAQAQFTPKTVETQDERDSLMFRVRVRIDPAVLAANTTPVKSGLPGLAYVRIDANAVWPAKLQGAAPK